MKVEWALASRFLYKESDEQSKGKRKLRPVVRISTIGIALSVMLILLSIFVIQGFQKELRSKINGFSGTIRISNPDNNYAQYTVPLVISNDLKDELALAGKKVDASASVNSFVDEMSMVKVDSAFRAVMMHGVDVQYDSIFLRDYLVEGRIPAYVPDSTSNSVLISEKLAKHLDLACGDSFMSYFMKDEGMKIRRFEISGLFKTGFEDYDDHLIITDQRILQSVKDWDENEVSGVTVTLDDSKDAEKAFDVLFPVLADRNAKLGERYTTYTVEELNYNIFGWLKLLDANVTLILILMIAVAGMTIITGLVVLILEKVRTIATLKALGQRNSSLRRVFSILSANILFRGILYGNLLAIILALVQKYLKPISLDPSQYYMTHVPVEIDLGVLLMTNLVVFILVILFILIPTSIISNIKPSKSLRFE